MLNDNAKFFTEDFKTKTISMIRAQRDTFCRETFRATLEEVSARPHDFATLNFHAGYRFMDDDQCWHSFVTVATKGQPWVMRHDQQNKQAAQDIEFEMDRDRDLWSKSVWTALKRAAECDHHYTFEKEY